MGKSLQYYYHTEPEAGEGPDFVVESYITKLVGEDNEYITKLVGEDNEYIPGRTFSGPQLMELIINLAAYPADEEFFEVVPALDVFEAIQALAGIGRGLGKDRYVTIRYA